MFMGLGMPIPDLSNKPGPGRPGWGPIGSYDFQFEVTGAVTIKAQRAATGTFTIKWPDGTEQTTAGSNSIPAPNATAGIVSINNELDTTYADEFKIVGGQTNVSKVISWGNNAWSDVFEAFKDCTNLTEISTTSFLASGQGPNTGQGTYMESMFEGCTSLLEVDIRNWNLENGVSWKNNGPFINLANLQKLDATGLKIKFRDNASYSYSAFAGIGTNVANGCEFKLSGLDLSTSPSNYIYNGMFSSNKFKDGSNLSGIKWPTGLSNPNGDYALGRGMFNSSTILGTLDCSGWTTWNSRRAPSFASINMSLTSQDGSKVNLSNLNLTSTWNFYTMFNNCRLYEVIGLNTWTASAGGVNMRAMFKDAKLMRINPNDNFSSAFTSSLSPTYSTTGNVNWQQRRAFYEMCFNMGNLLLDSEAGAPPSFANVDFTDSTLAGPSIFYRFGYGAKLTNTPDLTTAVFSSSVPISFANIFERSATITDTNNHFVLNNQNLKIQAISQAFWSTNIRKITIGNNVDMSAITSFDFMFYASGLPVNSIFLPSNADYSSLATISSSGSVNYFIGGNAAGALSTCQVDTFIRRNRATNSNTNVNAELGSNKITAAPSVARADADYLVNNQSWSITVGSPDAALPFAYASYAVDPTGITTISPTTTPPAGSVFTATNSLSINSSTGVITIGSFRGGSTIRCTYPDGCYNEVVMLIQVPFAMNITIPSGSTNFELKPQMSAGECFVDWGDNSSQILTANTTHSYASSGSDQTYPVKIFDSPSGSKFTGFNSSWSATSGGYIDDIAQWGEIEWQNNSWFVNTSKSTITATDTPNLSQVTSLQQMFSSNGINSTFSGGSAISNWDVSTITNMSSMFWKVGSANFTQNLSNWDVSNVTTLQRFNYTYPEYVSYNQNWVADWGNKTSNVEDFSYFMYGGKNNNIATNSNMGNYNTSSATNMSYMFFNNGGDIANCKTKIVNAGQADEYVAWDVKKVANFSYMFAGGFGRFVSTEFPDNWYISGDSQDINMQNMFGWFYGSGSLNNITDLNSFATKTISAGTSPYGTQYTAWNMSNTTNLIGFAQGNNANQLNWNINTWQISNKLTRFDSLFNTRSTNINWTYTLDQDLGHWDISNVTNATNSWFNNYTSYNPTPTGFSVNFSTANYSSLLDITDGWGQDAGSVQSGVTLNMGTSQYTPGNLYYGTQGANTYQNNKIYNGGADLRLFTSIGDVVERPVDPNGTFDAYAIITGYDANGQRATTQGNIGPTDYTVMDSNAAKGRVALINAGWTITDGGAYIPFDSVEMTINVSAGDTFSITPQSSPNNFKVDWGDGNGFVGDPNNGGANYTGSGFTATSPAYASGGNKTVKICEDSSQYIHSLSQNYNGPSASDKQKIININHWGTNSWKTFYRTFFGCNNLVLNTTTTPNLANGPIMAGMFQTSQGDFTNSNISNWDMSSITNASGMFQQTTSFNVDISNWDVGNVTNFTAFMYNNSVFNQDVSNWDTSNVTTMYYMFAGCSSLNADLNTKDTGSRLAWDVSNVTSFQSMLSGTTSMTYDIDKWQITTDASKTVTLANMFTGNINWMSMEPKTVTVGSGAYQKTYLAWDTQRVTSLSETFYANSAFNKDIGKWDTSNVANMFRTFRYATSFNNGGQPMNTRSVTVGTGATARTYNAWDVSNVTVFERGPFENNQAFNQDVSNWDVSNAPNALVRGFENAQVFDHYLPWNLNTSANPPNAYYLFNMFNNSGMSTNNYTDTLVYWANFVKNQTPNAPLNVNMNAQGGRTFDSNRSGGSNFANAFAAREFLTNTVANGGAGWTINGDTITALLVSSTNSLSFNGSTEYIDTFYAPDSSLANAFSISAYVKASSIDTSGNAGNTIIGTYDFTNLSGSGGQNRARFFVNIQLNSGAYELLVGFGTFQNAYELSNFTLSQWNHIAVTYDGSNLKLYCNGGSPEHTISLSSLGSLPPLGSYDAHLYIGATNRFSGTQSVDQHWHGDIDEVMLWNTAITQANVQTIDDAIGSGNVPDPNSLSSGVQLWNRMGD